MTRSIGPEPPVTARGTVSTDPGARGYTVLGGWARFHVNPDLRRRLFERELDVFFERAVDLRDAVRQAAQKEAEQHQRNNRELAHRWRRKQELRAKGNKMFVVNRAFTLAGGPPCRYCGAPATHADHVVPQARGGTHTRHNLVPACGPCNRQKWRWTVEEWQLWREERGLPWPPVWAVGRASFRGISKR
jgi:5-methylcytosine-specific restriction endonuclease McrA